MLLLRCVNLSGFTYQVYTPSFRGAVCTPLGGPSLHTLFTYPVYIPVYTSSLRAQFAYLLPGLPPTSNTCGVGKHFHVAIPRPVAKAHTLHLHSTDNITTAQPTDLVWLHNNSKVLLCCNWVSSTHGDSPKWLGVKMCWRIT